MPVDSVRQNRRQPSDIEERGRQTQYLEEPAAGGSMGFLVALLLLLAVIAVCAAGFFAVRVLISDSPPAPLPASVTRTDLALTSSPNPDSTSDASLPGVTRIEVNPQQGYINTLVTVTGQGWWPGEPVFVFLRSRQEGDGPGYAYAAAVADDRGAFRTAFTFPNEMRWIGEEWADVIARGTRSESEAIMRFSLVVPTATSTAPLPTARPTLPLTDTPRPTDAPSTVPTPTPDMIIGDWRGEYYANPTLAGDPEYVRNDGAIEFNWGGGSPDPRIPNDRFSARWTREQFFSDGFYRFTILADDGVRLWIDGQLVVDEWHDGGSSPYSLDLYLPQDRYSLRLEYYENLGGAMIQLSWGEIEPPPATSSPTPTLTGVPSATPMPTSTPSPTPETGLPVIHAFSVIPELLPLGGCVDISWITGGGTVWVTVIRDEVVLLDNAPLVGMLRDCPSTPGELLYVLVAYDPQDQRARQDRKVIVTQ